MNKLKSKEGSAAIVLLVGILAITVLMMTSLLINNEKYNNVQMTNRITSRYLAESAIDVQKYLLHNKFDNTELKIYFVAEEDEYSGQDIRRYYPTDQTVGDDLEVYGDTVFKEQEVSHSGGMEGINTAVDKIMTEVGKYSTMREFKTNLKLSDPENFWDTELRDLCISGSFLQESLGGSHEGLRCTIQDLYFTSDISFTGGSMRAVIRVSGLEAVRESFYSTEVKETYVPGDVIETIGMGEVRARFDTRDLEITTYSFQNY